MKEYIYFAQGRSSGNIKIGWTRQLWQRLAHIQAHSGERIDLRAHVVGKDLKFKETLLHRHHKKARLHGEWYAPEPELVGAIDHLRSLKSEDELERYDAVQVRWINDPVRL